MDKSSLIRIGAQDILWRTQDAEFLLREAFSAADAVEHLDKEIDEGETKNLAVRHHLARLYICLWEAALVKICSCWSYTDDQKYQGIIYGKKPALVINHVSDECLKQKIIGLRRVRNEEIAHPFIATQRVTDLAIRRTDSSGPFRALQTTFATVRNRYYPTEEIFNNLNEVVDYTMRESKRMSKPSI